MATNSISVTLDSRIVNVNKDEYSLNTIGLAEDLCKLSANGLAMKSAYPDSIVKGTFDDFYKLKNVSCTATTNKLHTGSVTKGIEVSWKVTTSCAPEPNCKPLQ